MPRNLLELLLGYAGTLKRIPETNDAPLLVGLEGLKIIYATEILRHTYKKMTVVQFNEISRMIREVFLPVMENFTIVSLIQMGIGDLL